MIFVLRGYDSVLAIDRLTWNGLWLLRVVDIKWVRLTGPARDGLLENHRPRILFNGEVGNFNFDGTNELGDINLEVRQRNDFLNTV